MSEKRFWLDKANDRHGNFKKKMGTSRQSNLRYYEKDVKEFIKINSEISEEEGKSVIIKDTFQEGFEFAVNRLKRTAGRNLI